jgi:hypothetical protein
MTHTIFTLAAVEVSDDRWTFLAALLAVIPVTITAIGGLLVSLSNRRDSKVSRAASDEKLDEIHTATNSNLTLVRERLDEANKRIVRMEEILGRVTLAAVQPAPTPPSESKPTIV